MGKINYSMSFERKEEKYYPNRLVKKLTKQETEDLIRDISSHFNVIVPIVFFHPNSDFGGGLAAMYCDKNHNFIVVDGTCSLGIIIHEFTHHLTSCEHNGIGHNKWFMKNLHRSYAYASKKYPEAKRSNNRKNRGSGSSMVVTC
ncbi:MAG: hypothetical protein WC375_12745 [Methanomassiliicoccales archaeon]|jgi:hypothetical protein